MQWKVNETSTLAVPVMQSKHHPTMAYCPYRTWTSCPCAVSAMWRVLLCSCKCQRQLAGNAAAEPCAIGRFFHQAQEHAFLWRFCCHSIFFYFLCVSLFKACAGCKTFSEGIYFAADSSNRCASFSKYPAPLLGMRGVFA